MLNLLNACCLRVCEVSGSEVKRKQLLSVRCHSPVPVASLNPDCERQTTQENLVSWLRPTPHRASASHGKILKLECRGRDNTPLSDNPKHHVLHYNQSLILYDANLPALRRDLAICPRHP